MNSSPHQVSRSRCLVRAAVFAAAVAGIAIPLGLEHGESYTRIDSEWYLLIAQGRTAEAMQPFTARQLDPLLARGLAAVAPLTLPHAFFAVGVLSLLATAAIVGYLLCRRGAGLAGLAAVGVLYFWAATFSGFMLPDTLSAGLLACFLLCLWARKNWLAAALLLPMFVARESTILVLVCLLAVAWKHWRWRLSLAAIAASFSGLAIVKELSAHALGNREQISPLLYMAGKVPWNFSANILSMRPWTPSLTAFCAVPRYTFHIPFGLHIGGAQTAGLCGWDPAWQVHPLLLMLCSFGLLPLCTVYLLRYHRGTLWTEDLFTRFCVVYGALSFLVAPLLGHTVERLFLYAWPIFLLATPVAMAQVFGPMADRRGLWLRLAAIHVATVGLGVMIFQVRDQATWQLAWSLTACVAAANVAAWWMLRRLELARSA